MPSRIKLSKYTDKSGLCKLYGFSDVTFIQDEDLKISRLKITNCSDCLFEGKIRVKGNSDKENTFSDSAGITNQPLISILKSPRITFRDVYVEGLVGSVIQSKPYDSDSLKDASQTFWKKNVPNGIYMNSRNTHIDKLVSKYVHHSVVIRSQHCSIVTMETDTFSGDDGHISASNTTIGNSVTKNAIQMFTYKQCHRDVKQIHTEGNQKKVLSNINLYYQKYTDGKGVFSKSPDGVVIHTDGIIDNCRFLNIDAISDTPENGVGSVCARNCHIKVTRLHSPKKTKLGIYIKKKDPPKPQKYSYGNFICCPPNTITDIQQPSKESKLPTNKLQCPLPER